MDDDDDVGSGGSGGKDRSTGLVASGIGMMGRRGDFGGEGDKWVSGAPAGEAWSESFGRSR